MGDQPKWTPGPWAIMGPTSQDGFMIYDRGMYGVGEAWNLNGRPENEANAHLIAAAPDLYVALEIAQFWLDIDGRYDMQVINAALAKARGEA